LEHEAELLELRENERGERKKLDGDEG